MMTSDKSILEAIDSIPVIVYLMEKFWKICMYIQNMEGTFLRLMTREYPIVDVHPDDI